MPAAIECRNLRKTYDGKLEAVRGLNLQIQAGECFGLLGPNGAGKTTTIEILEGLLKPTSGEVTILGHTWATHTRELREWLGISLQETRLSEKLSVRETINLFASFYRNPRAANDVINELQLAEKADAWVGKLSGGQRQRLAVATALVGNPKILFLDEPTTGLDPQSRRQLWEIIRAFLRGGGTVLLTTHYMDEAERLCDRLAIIDHGEVIAEGNPAELIERLGGHHVVEFAVGGKSDAGLYDGLKKLTGVESLRDENGITSLNVREPHLTIPPLLDLLRSQNLQLAPLDHTPGESGRRFRTLNRTAPAGRLIFIPSWNFERIKSLAVAEPTPSPILRSPAPRENGRWTGFAHLLGARMRELIREPELIFWIFVFPLLLAAGLGIAFRNKPVEGTSIVIVNGPGAKDVLDLIRRSPASSSIKVQVQERSQALRSFHLGKYDLVVEADGGGGVRYTFDPSRQETVLSRAEVDDALQAGAGRKNAVPISSFVSTEPGSRYIDFLIPGLLGMTLMNSGMWGIGFALVDMRQRKLLKRFVATPMRKSDFLLALASSRLVLMLLEMGLLLGLGVLAFHVRILGSLGNIFLLGALGSTAFGGLGLLTASRAKKIETVSGLINLAMMPMWIFSGVFFSYEHFPAKLQTFIKVLPLTALNDALRETILQGASLSSQAGRLTVLALWGGISFLLAMRWFRWT